MRTAVHYDVIALNLCLTSAVRMNLGRHGGITFECR